MSPARAAARDQLALAGTTPPRAPAPAVDIPRPRDAAVQPVEVPECDRWRISGRPVAVHAPYDPDRTNEPTEPCAREDLDEELER